MHCHQETRFDSAIRPLPTVTEAERLDFCDPEIQDRAAGTGDGQACAPELCFLLFDTSPATNSPPLVCRNPYTASAIPPAKDTAAKHSRYVLLDARFLSPLLRLLVGRRGDAAQEIAGQRRRTQSDNQHPRDEDPYRSHVVSLWPTLREKRGCLEPVAHCPDRRLGRPRFVAAARDADQSERLPDARFVVETLLQWPNANAPACEVSPRSRSSSPARPRTMCRVFVAARGRFVTARVHRYPAGRHLGSYGYGAAPTPALDGLAPADCASRRPRPRCRSPCPRTRRS